jgi:hypothetical protein
MGLVDASSTPKELDDARKTVKRATKSLRKRGLISRPAESVGWRGGCSDYDICPELRGPHEAPDFVREDPDEIDADGWARQRRWDEDEGDGARLDDDVPWVERASQVVSLASPA